MLPNLGQLRGGQALTVILTGDFSSAEDIVSWKSGRELRSSYDYGMDVSSMPDFFLTVIRSNIFFYLKPFVTDLSNISDLIGFTENLLRLSLIFVLVSEIVKSKFDRKAYFILFCYLAFNAIWAIGTFNYGTGSRHHITTIPLLLMLYSHLFSDAKIIQRKQD